MLLFIILPQGRKTVTIWKSFRHFFQICPKSIPCLTTDSRILNDKLKSRNQEMKPKQHLEEAEVVKEPAQVVDDFGARDEDLSHAVVDDEVQVPLSEPSFLQHNKQQFTAIQFISIQGSYTV